jgi:hypothetical protein
MLAKVINICRGRLIRTSFTLEIAEIRLKNFTRDTINQSCDIFWIETMTINCDSLATSSWSHWSIDWIDSCYSLSLIASCVLVVASYHSGVHVHGITYTESELNIGGCSWCYGSHASSNLILIAIWITCTFFNKAFKVDTIPVKSKFDPGKLRQCRAHSVLWPSGVENNLKLRITVYNLRSDVV